MRRLVVVIVQILCFMSLYSQDTLSVFYNKDWKEVKTREEAAYYRIAFQNKDDLWEAYDYFMSGKLQMIGAYSDKKMTIKEGNYVFFYENGNKSEESNYKNGKLDGILTTFFDNGKVKRKTNYSNGKKNGAAIAWFESGVKLSEGKFVNGFEDGLWIFYHENSKKKSQGEIKNGKLDGYWIFWFDNDSIQGKGKFILGKKDSIWVHYHEFGNLAEIDSFVDRELAGIKGFHENGLLSYSGSYTSEKKTGLWQYYSDSGEPMFIGNFLNGKKEGEWTRYFPNNKIMKVFYKEDKVMNKDLGSILLDEQ
jgi:antitoxin component YwqK of YwqJK toxin-antitoxin module